MYGSWTENVVLGRNICLDIIWDLWNVFTLHVQQERKFIDGLFLRIR